MKKKEELFKYIENEGINISIADLDVINNIIDELIEECYNTDNKG